MEAMEELSGSNTDHHTLIVKGKGKGKGKRTKRPRPSSPFAMAVTSSSSSGGVGDVYFPSALSPTSSDEFSTSTEEDEDMANCLILLAQGVGVGVGPRQAEEEVGGGAQKLGSRRFTEVATTTAGKAGIFVYECKTCNRSFPSFQALGGHRASHKKPKAAAAEEIKKPEEGGQFMKLSPPLSLPLLTSTKASHGSKRPKVHECSICGSEFSSGQALGGHMRRHRTPTNAPISMTFDTATVEWAEDDKPRHVLTLDLNLPAPEDDGREAKFPFTASQQRLVFSTPALVDCHY